MVKQYKSVVVFSGGQDSSVCLRHAIEVHGHYSTLALAFDYGQKHRVELASAKTIAEKWGVDYQVVEVPALRLMQSSSLVNGGISDRPHRYLKDRPASFVPARNAMFLTIAFGIAMETNAHAVYTGVCETDFSGYPDCRAKFIDALELALNIGYEQRIKILTPLMHVNKAKTFAMAERMGVLDDILHYSHTCYEGDHSTRWPWGYGCGLCPACTLRANGYNQYLASKK